jgi:hypothetical protein
MLHEGKTDTDIVLVAGFAWVGIRANNLPAGGLVMTRHLGWLALSLLGASVSAYAQTACPQGVSPGDPRCGPGGGGWLPPPPSSEPSMHWKKTWGAIAMSSGGTGEVGTSVGKTSKREATREAVSKCEALGGRECKLALAYKNQCAVVAWPSVTGVSVAAVSAASIEEASNLALSDCNTSGGACKIVYSDCTPPIPVYD